MLKKIGMFSALSFALSGCSTKLPPKHITFEPTNSACLDALIANFAYAKCKDVEEEGSWGEQIKIYCKNPKKETQWAMRSYYIITTYWGGYAPEGAMPLCADQGLILLYTNEVSN